jgi:hypothetical protein
METYGVEFTPEKLQRFKKELAKHEDKNATFEFEGKEWLVEYARYLAYFLDGVFATGRKKYWTNGA